jgi:hypothetical protein
LIGYEPNASLGVPITVDPEPLLVTIIQPTVESDLFRLFYRHGQPRHDNSVREEKQQPNSSFVEVVVDGDTLSLLTFLLQFLPERCKIRDNSCKVKQLHALRNSHPTPTSWLCHVNLLYDYTS